MTPAPSLLCMGVAERAKARRKALKLTQEQVAAASGLPQDTVSKLETGKNLGSTWRTLAALATGLQCSVEYLRGETDSLGAPPTLGAGGDDLAPRHGPADGAGDSPLDAALAHAFDATAHALRDLDAVRSALRGSVQLQAPESDLRTAARRWLDAAAAIRAEGGTATYDELLFRVTIGRRSDAHERRAAHEADAAVRADADARARTAGLEPGAARHVAEDIRRTMKRRRGSDD